MTISITGQYGYRAPGCDWEWVDGRTVSMQDVRYDLFDNLVNDDESDTVGVDVAIRDKHGAIHIVARATDVPADLL